MTILNDQDSQPSTHPDLWTVRRIIAWSVDYLNGKADELKLTSRLDVELLLTAVLGLDRVQLYLQMDRPVNKDERESFKLLLRRRADFEPIAYILGYKDFYRHRFKVTRDVLIPRPETEMLVESCVAALKDAPAPRILDVGTGSGCLAVSLAAALPQSHVEAWDVSDVALDVARANAEQCQVRNISFLNRDAKALGMNPQAAFDLIVTNPPYIARSETRLMSRGVLQYEPELALFTQDASGTEFYEIFASCYQSLLKPGGKIFLEIGYGQGAKVAHLFEQSGWGKIKVSKDLAGHDRMVSAEKPQP